MDVSNASVYDGATAAAEAAAMCRGPQAPCDAGLRRGPSRRYQHCRAPTATARATELRVIPAQGRKDRSGRPARSFWRPRTPPACASSSRTSSASLRTPKRSARSSMQRARMYHPERATPSPCAHPEDARRSAARTSQSVKDSRSVCPSAGAARISASWPPRRSTCVSCRAVSSARRSIRAASAALSCRCRRASSTSAARRPAATSARTRRCAR